MLVRELFKNLIVGELSNLTIGEKAGPNNTLDDKYFAKLISYTNNALASLHRKFLLKEKFLIIECQDWRTDYPLRKEWAVSNPNPPAKPFIIDIAWDTFENDVYKIIKVKDMTGRYYPINDTGRVNSLYTPYPDTLQVPNPLTGMALWVAYQGGHRKLTDKHGTEEEVEETLNQVIDLPVFLEPALQKLIGSETFSHMTGADNIATSEKFKIEYEQIVLEVKEQDLASMTHHTTISKLERRGFV